MSLLVAEAIGKPSEFRIVTVTGPVAALAGTATITSPIEELTTVAVRPPAKLTTVWPRGETRPSPSMAMLLPAGALLGLTVAIAGEPAECEDIASRFPA